MTTDNADKVWDLVEKIPICMLVTHDGEDIRSRPMGAYPCREENAVYFLTDSRRHKDEEVARDPRVCIAFSDPGSQTFVSLTGQAVVLNDREKIKEFWSLPAKAWWDSPDDPAIRLLRVTPKDAEYWDAPGKVVSYVKMAAAALSKTRPALGENKKVAL
ncbi:MAG: pyridoxamine 5'-phosphate oxidase family protein [Xanthobacteraceae bacterium]